MERIRLARKKWPLVVSLSVFAGIELILYFAVTKHALAAAFEGRQLEGEWGWTGIVGWHLFVALVGFALAWQPLKELRTFFTAEGIGRPRLFGPPLFIRWDEIETIFIVPVLHRPYTIRIDAPRGSVEINALYYERPRELLSLIEERMRAFTPAPDCAKLVAR